MKVSLKRAGGVLAGCLLALTTACSAGSGTTDAPGNAETVASKEAQAIADSYTGELSKLPTSFGEYATTEKLKIGWSAAREANEINARLGEAIQSQVEANGGTFVGLDADGDVNKQVNDMSQLINDGVDAMIVWPLDANSLSPVIELAHSKNIPVIAMEADPTGNSAGDFDAQVIFGRDAEAYLSAKLMATLHPEIEVGIMKFAVPVPSIDVYAERAKYWAEQSGLKVMATVDNPSDEVAGGESATGPMLSQYPDLQGILAYNDPSAIGAATAARSAGRQVYGFGLNGHEEGLAAVKQGTIAMTIQPPLVQWGKELVAAAYLKSEGKDVPNTVYPGIGEVITGDNANQAQTFEQILAETNWS